MEGFEKFDEKFAQTRHGRLFYLHRKGPGRPIIFLHGVGASVRSWRRLISFIPVSLDVYLIDLLGHGRSDAPPIDYDIMAQVNVLRDMVTSVGINDPALFGHSYGAWVATHYAIRNKTPSLILEDSAGLGMQVAQIVDAGNKEIYTDNIVAESLKIGANETVMRSIISNFEKDTLTKEVLSKVNSRTLLLWGADDNVVPLKFGEWERESIRGSRLVIIPHGGHVPHFVAPGLVGREIAEFNGLPI